jgi:uncharacterized membrane protein YphA (DoxX/SURF4 family)
VSREQGRRGPGAWILDSISLAARLALGGVFLYACWFKVVDPEDFAINIATYQILPDSAINVMAITLPWLELSAGVLLVAGAFSREAALAVGGMLAMFIVAILVAMGKDLKISCGCFASEAAQADIGWPKVAEDVVMLAGAAWVVARGGGLAALDGLLARLRARGSVKTGAPGPVKDGQGGKREP